MKLKFAIGVALLMGVSAVADAASAAKAQGISLGVVLTPVFKLADSTGVLLNPVLQPVLSITGPVVAKVVPQLHPVFVLIGTITGERAGGSKMAPLPGLPN